MPVTHPFVSLIADGGDATLVRPSNWNADHSFPDKNVFITAPGAVSIATTGVLEQPLRLGLASTDRATLAGTGRLILSDAVFDPPVLRYRAPGSFSVMPDEFTLHYQRISLNGNVRVTNVGTGRVQVTDFAPSGRLVLSGRG